MKLKALYFFALMMIAFSAQATEVPIFEKGERKIVVVAASYNNKNYYQKHLDSIFMQQYENYHVIYVDDCSTDGTYDLVKMYLNMRGWSENVTLIRNETRRGALANQYYATHMCASTDIIVILDADDWLIDSEVFPYLNGVYSDPNVWLTYGQFTQYPTGHRGWNVQIPDEVSKNNSFRKFTHAPSHLRTYYAGLFQHIKKEDLLYEGDFFRMTGDIAAMFPMIEMARDGHFKFIPKVLMVYNIGNPINDHKIIEGLQRKIDLVIRALTPYEVIESPFIFDEQTTEKVGDAKI